MPRRLTRSRKPYAKPEYAAFVPPWNVAITGTPAAKLAVAVEANVVLNVCVTSVVFTTLCVPATPVTPCTATGIIPVTQHGTESEIESTAVAAVAVDRDITAAGTWIR